MHLCKNEIESLEHLGTAPNQGNGQTESPANSTATPAASNSSVNVNSSQPSPRIANRTCESQSQSQRPQQESVDLHVFGFRLIHLFCTENLLGQLGTKGKKSTLSLTTMQAFNKQIECCTTSLEIFDLSEQHQIKLPRVYSRPSLQSQTKLSKLKI